MFVILHVDQLPFPVIVAVAREVTLRSQRALGVSFNVQYYVLYVRP